MASDPPSPRPERALFPVPSPARWWKAVVAGTVVLQFGYWPVVAAALRAPEGDAAFIQLLGLGLSVMPLVFIVLAFGSRHPRAPRAVLRGMGLFIVIALPLLLVHVVAGLVAGYGAGAAATLRREPSDDRLLPRVVAVLLATAWTFILTAIALPVGVLTGALVTLPAVALADLFMRHRRPGSDARPPNLRSP